ncbi:hypothetical protein MM213_06430 [Belliella sp. R4-6]|uniref:KTSC domain-containing protein n=1 Tax=Belliella alkalica TaxID=1730871 RepID=A0ABS9V9K8_9BACT|nr:hypothetical protein [Belliella alkalica]MCH7413111.1 hypothetical protein [Belliella alkalica]
MNKVNQISVEYITPSRSIEVYKLTSLGKSKLVFVYNYEGIQFRFFESIIDLIRFFEIGREPMSIFGSEEELDDYLNKILVEEYI